MRLPPDDNKVDPEVAAACLVKFTKPGGRRRPDGGDIVIPPVNPGGTGPPPGGITSIGTGPGIPLKYCKCFPVAGSYTAIPHRGECPVAPGRDPEDGTLHEWIWKQVCLETDWQGLVNGSNDPRGGWAEINRVQRNWPPCKLGVEFLLDWFQADAKFLGADCLDKLSGRCDKKCNDFWIWAVCCPIAAVGG